MECLNMNNLFQYELDKYIEEKRKYFMPSYIDDIRYRIVNSGKSMGEIKKVKLKSPIVGQGLSIFVGWLGIDRFYSGNYIWALIKLFTGGGCFIGWLIDIFLIKDSIKRNNYLKFSRMLNNEKNKVFNVDDMKNSGQNFINYVKTDEGKKCNKENNRRNKRYVYFIYR